jgi:hypothetical protein
MLKAIDFRRRNRIMMQVTLRLLRTFEAVVARLRGFARAAEDVARIMHQQLQAFRCRQSHNFTRRVTWMSEMKTTPEFSLQ